MEKPESIKLEKSLCNTCINRFLKRTQMVGGVITHKCLIDNSLIYEAFVKVCNQYNEGFEPVKILQDNGKVINAKDL